MKKCCQSNFLSKINLDNVDVKMQGGKVLLFLSGDNAKTFKFSPVILSLQVPFCRQCLREWRVCPRLSSGYVCSKLLL